MYAKLHILALGFLPLWISAQEVQTIELSTSEVHPLNARIGHACLIQLPSEPIATNVGDPFTWLVEKTERVVSIKPLQEHAKDTNLAVLTRQGTLNFSVHLVSEAEPFTQMVRLTKILDDSKPLPPMAASSPESLAETLVREIRIVQNYYALKTVNSPDLRNVEKYTQLRESGDAAHTCALLQTFRFRDTRHIVLHFVTENKTDLTLWFDQRKTTVMIGETIFSPMAVSLGKRILEPTRSAENFIVLNGSNGLSHRQTFHILLAEEFLEKSASRDDPPTEAEPAQSASEASQEDPSAQEAPTPLMEESSVPQVPPDEEKKVEPTTPAP